MKNVHLTMTALIALFCASACCNHADKPENVIYLIGDGMGFGAYPKHVFSTKSKSDALTDVRLLYCHSPNTSPDFLRTFGSASCQNVQS